jgi:hypothetical protein
MVLDARQLLGPYIAVGHHLAVGCDDADPRSARRIEPMDPTFQVGGHGAFEIGRVHARLAGQRLAKHLPQVGVEPAIEHDRRGYDDPGEKGQECGQQPPLDA